MNSLKSFDIQLTDIWIECQKEMIEMRNKIMNLSDCLKTSELINRHLSKCNETLVAIVEKCSLNDHKNKVMIDLIDVIRAEEECIAREKQNLRTFGDNLNNNKVNDKRVFELIKVWNQCKPKRASTKDKGIQAIDVYSLTQIQSLAQIDDKSPVDCNERPKRHRKVISYKALHEGIDVMDRELKNKEELNQIDNTFNDKNFRIMTDWQNVNKSEVFGTFGEELANTQSDSDYEEAVDNEDIDGSDIEIKDQPTKSLIAEKCLNLKANELKEKVANNEYDIGFDEYNQYIKKFYLKSKNPNEVRLRIGFGCTLSECDVICSRRADLLRHFYSRHKDSKPIIDKINEIEKCRNRIIRPNIPNKKRKTHQKLVKKELKVLVESNQTVEVYDENNDLVKILRLKEETNPRRAPVGYGCGWTGCQYVTVKRFNLIEHINLHQNIRPFACNLCDHKAVSNRQLNKHKYSVHERERVKLRHSTTFRCDWEGCDHNSVSARHLQVHKFQHSGERPFKCVWPSCEYSSFTKSTLYKHQLTHNNADKRFPCEWPGCEYKGRDRWQLFEHKRVHDEGRHLKCSWPGCEATFRTRGSQGMHMVVHTGDKRRLCCWPGCDSRFRDGAGLRAHLMVHRNEKPIKCLDSECDHRFRHKTQMKIHFRLKHKNK